MTLALTYAQTQDIINLELESSGAAYDPFLAESEAAEGDDEHMGITIMKKKVEKFAYRLDEGVNRVRLEL